MLPFVNVYISRTVWVDSSFRGWPLRPPISCLFGSFRESGLETVVLETIKPSTPTWKTQNLSYLLNELGTKCSHNLFNLWRLTSMMTSAMSCLSCVERSGAIFTRTGSRSSLRKESRSLSTWITTNTKW